MFQIAVNRIHYCAFAFRIPIEKVKFLIILGDITVTGIQHGNKTFYPPENLKKIPKVVIPHPLTNENVKCEIRVCVFFKILLSLFIFLVILQFFFSYLAEKSKSH